MAEAALRHFISRSILDRSTQRRTGCCAWCWNSMMVRWSGGSTPHFGLLDRGTEKLIILSDRAESRRSVARARTAFPSRVSRP